MKAEHALRTLLLGHFTAADLRPANGDKVPTKIETQEKGRSARRCLTGREGKGRRGSLVERKRRAGHCRPPTLWCKLVTDNKGKIL